MTNPTWFPDELKHAGRENLDREHVASYDTKEDAGAAAEVALLREHGLGPEWTVVEFGPGTGQFTVEVARAGAAVIAVDISPPMLEVLRWKVADLPQARVVQGGFLTYRHEGKPADLVYSRLALHHLPDFWKVIALRRMREVLGDGGLLRLVDVVYDCEPDQVEEQLEAWAAQYEDGGPGEWTRSDIEEHLRDEHSTFAWLLEPMIRHAGFEIMNVHRDGLYASYLARAAPTDTAV